jgi:nitroreductase
MDMVELIKSRRAVRSFNPREVDEQTIEKILEAGRYAPSPQNSQPWHFTLIRNKESLKHLASAAKHAGFLSNAPLLIIVTVNREAPIDDWLIQHNQHIYSGAAAMQNMWLAACSLDIGCCWVTLDEKTTRKLLIIPEEQALIGAFALGYSDDNVCKPHEEGDRTPLASMTSFEQFGKSSHCNKEGAGEI